MNINKNQGACGNIYWLFLIIFPILFKQITKRRRNHEISIWPAPTGDLLLFPNDVWFVYLFFTGFWWNACIWLLGQIFRPLVLRVLKQLVRDDRGVCWRRYSWMFSSMHRYAWSTSEHIMNIHGYSRTAPDESFN